MAGQIKVVTIALDVLLKAEQFKVQVLLDQLEKDNIEIVCYTSLPLKGTKLKLKEAGYFGYFDAIITSAPKRGIYISNISDIDYPSVMLALGQRRPRLPLAVMLNLYAVDPLPKKAILDG